MNYRVYDFNRGKMFFGYNDRELMEKGGYDLVHNDDLTYFAAAHQECKFYFQTTFSLAFCFIEPVLCCTDVRLV
jgi:PAS fold